MSRKEYQAFYPEQGIVHYIACLREAFLAAGLEYPIAITLKDTTQVALLENLMLKYYIGTPEKPNGEERPTIYGIIIRANR